jgi:hypothetical protein
MTTTSSGIITHSTGSASSRSIVYQYNDEYLSFISYGEGSHTLSVMYLVINCQTKLCFLVS